MQLKALILALFVLPVAAQTSTLTYQQIEAALAADPSPTAFAISLSPTAPVTTLTATATGPTLVNPDGTTAQVMQGEAHIYVLPAATATQPLTYTYSSKPACFISPQGGVAKSRAWAVMTGTSGVVQLRGVAGDTVAWACYAVTPSAATSLKRRHR